MARKRRLLSLSRGEARGLAVQLPRLLCARASNTKVHYWHRMMRAHAIL